MRAVKCIVTTTSEWPEKPKQYPCIDGFQAVHWIMDQGWEHVMHADCTLQKCVTARQFVLDEMVVMDSKRRPVVNTAKLYKWFNMTIKAGCKPYTPLVPKAPKETPNEDQAVQAGA